MIWQDEIQCFGCGCQAWHSNELLKHKPPLYQTYYLPEVFVWSL